MSELRYGLFSLPGRLSEGDPYDKGKKKLTGVDLRYKNAQFRTTPAKKGGGTLGLFDKEVRSLHAGSEYVEQARLERQLANRYRHKGDIGNGRFIPAGPTRKSSGAGDMYGTIGGGFKYESPFNVPQKGEASPRARVSALKPMMTNPPRKGGPGTNTRSFGQDPEHIADSYDGTVAQRRNDYKKKKAKELGGPFLGSSHTSKLFDESSIYKDSQSHLPMIRPKKKQSTPRNMYTGPCQKGPNGLFSSYEYKRTWDDSELERKRKARETNERKRIGGVFRYSSPAKSMFSPRVRPPKHSGVQTSRF